MDVEEDHVQTSQLPLFEISDASTGVVELFPTVWGAVESLTSPETAQRLRALEVLAKTRAARYSPLVAYVIFTRLSDPDLAVRNQVVTLLSDIYLPDEQGSLAPEGLRLYLNAHLARMRTREIYSLLQVVASYPQQRERVAKLLNACPYAGNHLADLAAWRKAPIEIRRYAIQLIGLVGYLDAIPALERMQTRLESRLNGQQMMPFAPPGGADDTSLLPDVRAALDALRSP